MRDPPTSDELEASQMFCGAWFDSNRDSAMQRTADWLIQKNLQPKDDPTRYIQDIALALAELTCEIPTAIDFLLQTFNMAVAQFPPTKVNRHSLVEEQARLWLETEIVERWYFFEQYSGEQEVVGLQHPDDCSELRFHESDVHEKLDHVLSRIIEWKDNRQNYTTSLAMKARSVSLGILTFGYDTDPQWHVNNLLLPEETADDEVESLSELSSPSEVEFIGTCLMLRGCARTLLKELQHDKTEEKFEQWKDRIAMSLYDSDFKVPNTFAVKAHVELALRNLRSGGRDEASKELFNPIGWIGFCTNTKGNKRWTVIQSSISGGR